MAAGKDKRKFDVELGKMIKGERIKSGYVNEGGRSSAEMFLAAVKKFTGVDIPLNTYRRIESGAQFCTVEQYAAIRYTLDEDFTRDEVLEKPMADMKDHHQREVLKIELNEFAAEAESERELGLPYPPYVENILKQYRNGVFDDCDTETLYHILRLTESRAMAQLLFGNGDALRSAGYDTPEKIFDAVNEHFHGNYYSKEFTKASEKAEHAESGEAIQTENNERG